jgi:hypothetical protein
VVVMAVVATATKEVRIHMAVVVVVMQEVATAIKEVRIRMAVVVVMEEVATATKEVEMGMVVVVIQITHTIMAMVISREREASIEHLLLILQPYRSFQQPAIKTIIPNMGAP